MKLFRLHREQRIELPIERVFEFFSDPQNLEAITPEWMRFRIVGCSDESIRAGTLIDYRLKVRGVPLRWRSKITSWNPPYSFTDEQVVGPYRRWVHLHSFEPDRGGTLACDDVEYAVPGGSLVERLLVRPDLERIFDYRQQRLPELVAS
jgi:ligand-binding SRPBCC domain-containing protein